MKSLRLRSNIALFFSAAIWGLAFVAQRVGMDHMGPMFFNGVRFAVGALSLVPLVLIRKRLEADSRDSKSSRPLPEVRMVFTSILAGVVLFAGASLQQLGIVYTTAGNAGFITSLYIILIPILGMLWGSSTSTSAWIGALIALVGASLLSMGEKFTFSPGDLLVFASAFFWALHVHIIGHGASRYSPLILSTIQYSIVSVLSMVAALIFEDISWTAIEGASTAIFYGGFMSVGVAYTLQVLGQKHAHPTHAGIILSLEGTFAALGGAILLSETLEPRQFFGAVLMVLAILISQIPKKSKSALSKVEKLD